MHARMHMRAHTHTLLFGKTLELGAYIFTYSFAENLCVWAPITE